MLRFENIEEEDICNYFRLSLIAGIPTLQVVWVAFTNSLDLL